jgi:hypothetical protein
MSTDREPLWDALDREWGDGLENTVEQGDEMTDADIEEFFAARVEGGEE